MPVVKSYAPLKSSIYDMIKVKLFTEREKKEKKEEK